MDEQQSDKWNVEYQLFTLFLLTIVLPRSPKDKLSVRSPSVYLKQRCTCRKRTKTHHSVCLKMETRRYSGQPAYRSRDTFWYSLVVICAANQLIKILVIDDTESET